MKYIFIMGIMLCLGGCTKYIEDVKPWQKGILAKESMTKSNSNTLFYKFQKHIYFSKEASKGGGGVAGGGCGCN